MQFIKTLLLVVLALIATSCSYFTSDTSIIQNRSTDYLKADSIPPLKIPPGMSSAKIQSEYPVSDANYPGSKTAVNLTPPGLNTSGN